MLGQWILCKCVALCQQAHLMRRSPAPEVYNTAHCTYALFVVTTLSSCCMEHANALSGSICSTTHELAELAEVIKAS